jgi:hypothetical protein
VGRDIQSAEIRPLRRVSRRVNRSNLSVGIFELRGLARTIKSSKSRDHAPKSISGRGIPEAKPSGAPVHRPAGCPQMLPWLILILYSLISDAPQSDK